MEKSKPVVKFLTLPMNKFLKASIIGLILGIINLIGISFTAPTIGILGVAFFIDFFVLLLIFRLLSKFSNVFKLSPQEWAIVVGFLGIGGIVLQVSSILAPIMYLSGVEPYYGTVKNILPDIWAPKERSLIEGAFSGGAAVPWGAWMPHILYWSAMILSIQLASYFLIALLFRRHFIEVEGLPFPYAVPTAELILMATGEKGRESIFSPFKSKPFWIFFAIGFVPIFINVVLSVAGLPLITFLYVPYGSIQSQSILLGPALGRILPGAHLQLIYHAGWLALSYLAPLDVLISAFIWYIIAWVVYPVIGNVMGIIPPGQGIYVYSLQVGPVRLGTFTDNLAIGGMALGVAVFTVVFARSEIKRTLMAAIRNEKPGPGEFDARLIWGGGIICSVIAIALISMSGVNPVMALFLFATIMLFFLYMTRMWGELGVYWIGWEDSALLQDIGSSLGFLPPHPAIDQGILSVGALQYAFAGHYRFNPDKINPLHAPLSPPLEAPTLPNYSMLTFRVADTTDTDPRQMAHTQLITIILAGLIGVPLCIWWYYNFGILSKLSFMVMSVARPGAGGASLATFYLTQPGYSTFTPPHWPWIIGGALFTGLLMFLRLRFAWFFLNPVGMIVGASCYCWTPMFNMLVAWILKTLTIRIGGAKAYEKIGQPAAIGWLIGNAFAYWLWGIGKTLPLLFPK
jgi:hypothetical protein